MLREGRRDRPCEPQLADRTNGYARVYGIYLKKKYRYVHYSLCGVPADLAGISYIENTAMQTYKPFSNKVITSAYL